MLYEKKFALIANFRLYLVRPVRLLILLLCACSLGIAEHTLFVRSDKSITNIRR